MTNLKTRKGVFEKIDLLYEEKSKTAAHLVPERLRNKYWAWIEEDRKKLIEEFKQDLEKAYDLGKDYLPPKERDLNFQRRTRVSLNKLIDKYGS